jgi:hypothetical protein
MEGARDTSPFHSRRQELPEDLPMQTPTTECQQQWNLLDCVLKLLLHQKDNYLIVTVFDFVYVL